MLGIELSKWNGNWNAAKAKSAGADFAFIQASQSITPDPLFHANWKKANEANLFCGAYHCLDSSQPAQVQADLLLGLLNGDQGELPIAVQIEMKDSKAKESRAVEHLQEFIEMVKAQGMTPMIATSVNSWLDPEVTSSSWAQYPLWVADYGSDEKPQLPAPWTRWSFWRFSEKGDGETFGTESFNIHLNTFNGSLSCMLKLMKTTFGLKLEARVQNLEKRVHAIDQFVSLLNEPAQDPLTENVEEPTLQKTSNLYAVCNANRLNVRNGPGLSHQVIGTLLSKQRVKVIKRQDEWALIQEPQGWISEKYIAFEET
jgi:GH25 family lysozyme M1 (1,4-beta-N-acetylmuramidase)